MSQRLTLTLIWLASFCACLGLVWALTFLRSPTGIVVLLPDDVPEVVKPVTILYGAYLTGILGFWFLKPFKPLTVVRSATQRFMIALVCTVLFNLVVIGLIARPYVAPSGNVLDEVNGAIRIAGMLSFIVAPVNLYYFGIKQDG